MYSLLHVQDQEEAGKAGEGSGGPEGKQQQEAVSSLDAQCTSGPARGGCCRQASTGC